MFARSPLEHHQWKGSTVAKKRPWHIREGADRDQAKPSTPPWSACHKIVQTFTRCCYRRTSSMRDSLAVEKHYRVKELADLWGFSENTIIKLFSNEDGVLRLESPTGKRKYATLSIPETVAIRVHERLGNQALKAASARRDPLRVVHLRDLDARMPKQPRYIANRNVTQ